MTTLDTAEIQNATQPTADNTTLFICTNFIRECSLDHLNHDHIISLIILYCQKREAVIFTRPDLQTYVSAINLGNPNEPFFTNNIPMGVCPITQLTFPVELQPDQNTHVLTKTFRASTECKHSIVNLISSEIIQTIQGANVTFLNNNTAIVKREHEQQIVILRLNGSTSSTEHVITVADITRKITSIHRISDDCFCGVGANDGKFFDRTTGCILYVCRRPFTELETIESPAGLMKLHFQSLRIWNGKIVVLMKGEGERPNVWVYDLMNQKWDVLDCDGIVAPKWTLFGLDVLCDDLFLWFRERVDGQRRMVNCLWNEKSEEWSVCSHVPSEFDDSVLYWLTKSD